MGRKFTRYFDSTPMSHHNITRHGLWHKAVASYLATATFTDKCVGRVLDSLDASPHRDNTIIVLWSDHGFHIGEKMHWEKRSLWEESTRVPLMFVLPKDQKVEPASCSRAVGLIDIYPTLVDLCELPKPKHELQGRSFVPWGNASSLPVLRMFASWKLRPRVNRQLAKSFDVVSGRSKFLSG